MNRGFAVKYYYNHLRDPRFVDDGIFQILVFAHLGWYTIITADAFVSGNAPEVIQKKTCQDRGLRGYLRLRAILSFSIRKRS
jgi:hypothetical protein